MNPLQRTLIEKAGHDNGFEHVLAQEPAVVAMASARHQACALVSVPHSGGFNILFQPASPALLSELHRTFEGGAAASVDSFNVATVAGLALLLRRAANLSQALPSQAEQDYQAEVAEALKNLPAGSRGTEVERLVRQRVGQDRFRAAMLGYWGGACSITKVNIPAVLRASHAKPWADCASDGERLDVFNGFLLCAHLDALFDRFLISFDETGRMLVSPSIAARDGELLGLDRPMRLRWLAPEHTGYLQYHRMRFSEGSNVVIGNRE
ncbi:HNH endonuclease [Variovorax guangxiensis]|uniref:HNH endonuclease n=1 Tax=Variovorax guangxiensis TaxID=1775474 RepID=A0A433MSU3_9BURK|nr:HNH endonuclease [Variovorax guangxiensis]RUR70933.1 HNH endonuclease [Variovorax guangxiensis]